MMRKQDIFHLIISEFELPEKDSEIIINLFDNEKTPLKWYDQYVIVCAIIIKIVNNYCPKYFKLFFDILATSKYEKVKKISLLGIALGSLIIKEKELKEILAKRYALILKKDVKLQKEFNKIVLALIRFDSSNASSDFLYAKDPFFDDFYKWFIPIHKNSAYLKNKVKEVHKEGINTKLFIESLVNSISLTKNEKYKVLESYPRLSEKKILELINVFLEEQQKFAELRVEYSDELEEVNYASFLEVFYLMSKQSNVFSLESTLKHKNKFPISVFADSIFDQSTFNDVGQLLLMMDNYDLAISFFKKYISSTEKKDLKVIRKIGWCYGELQEYEKAIKFYSLIIESKPDNKGVLFRIGVNYEMLEKYKVAIEYYLKSFKKDDEKIVTKRIALCYQKLKEYKNAIKYWEILILLEPNNINFLNFLGFCYAELNKHKKAIEYFNKVLRIEPFEKYALIEIADSLNKIGNGQKAEKYLEKVNRFYSNDSSAIHSIGWFYFTNKEFRKAKQFFEMSLKLDEQNKYALMNLGHIELLSGNKKNAISFYKNSLSYYEIDKFIEGLWDDYTYISDEVSRKEYTHLIDVLENGGIDLIDETVR